MNSKKTITCNNCGVTGLVWHSTKAGRYYLTDQFTTDITNDGGRTIKTIRPAHQCLTPEQQEIASGFQQAADQAHLLEAKRDAIKAQIDELLSADDLTDDAVALVRTLGKQSVVITGEIQALQVKFNNGWQF
jgi:hypothetical protein